MLHIANDMTHNDFLFKKDLVKPMKKFFKSHDIQINTGKNFISGLPMD